MGGVYNKIHMKKLLNFRKLILVAFIVVSFAVGAQSAEAGLFTKIYDFDLANGRVPRGSLIESNGKFYGMTQYKGTSNRGVIFEYDPATSTYTKKFSFGGTNGTFPQGSLIESNGKFYGMTPSGGTSDYGVIFEYNPATSTYTKKYDFSTDGLMPIGSLIESNSKFYGMAEFGGTSNRGVIFEYDPATSTYTNKYNFDGTTNGANPHGSLLVINSKFYGMTYYGGTSNRGVIFEYDPATSTYTKKYDFDVTNGANPHGSLIGSNGNLYGLTSTGGVSSHGVIFEYNLTTSTFTKKYDFGDTDGAVPYGSLIVSNGKLYGMTYNGGTSTNGVVFEYDLATSIYTRIYDFNDAVNGANPYSGSLLESNGKFYGLTSYGGTSSNGVIFEYDPANFAPTATSVSISGSAYLGSTLTGSYTYGDLEGDLEGTSTYQWYRDDIEILNATSTTYVVTADDINTTIKFGVVPLASSGTSPGILTQSSGVIPESFAPTATSVSISGSAYLGSTLTGSYTYGDLEGDLEGTSTYQWYRDDIEILNATSTTYVVTADDINTTIKFGVVPVASTGTSPGVLAQSIGTLILVNNAPTATSVSISGTVALGNTLTGQYVYTDVENDPEGVSTFQWYRNNVAIGSATNITYVVTADDLNKTIKFEVTPVASTGSSPGTAVTSSITPYILYESADTAVTPGSPGTLGTADNLASIYNADSDYWTTALSVTDGGYDSQVFKINLDSSGITNPKFSVVWTGHGDVPTDKMVTIYFYNFTTSAWEQVTTQHCSTDCTLTGNKTGTKYVDVDGNTWVWVKADNYVSPIEISNVVFDNLNHTLTWDTNVAANSEIMYSSNAYSDWGEFNNEIFGANPYGSLTEYNGSFYGMTTENEGNNLDVGTIFEYNPDTSTYTDKFHFNTTNGAYPKGSLINVNGVFYGTAQQGGANNAGTLFAWDPVTNTITKQYDFNTSDGENPRGSLINISGVLYGTTSVGGANSVGTLFAWDPVTNTITKQYDFNTSDGAYPIGSLINIGGVLYGITSNGGANNVGTLFAWDPVTNTITKQFDFNTSDGANPYGSLIDIGGVLYGTTSQGGANGAGTLFAWDPVTNTITKQYDFNTTDGAYPQGSLINISGVLYGTTYQGGANGVGTLFAWDPVTNTITKKYDFNYSDGAYPRGSLIEINGVLYGTTYTGGPNDAGTLFAWDPVTNTQTILHTYYNSLVRYSRDDTMVTSHSIQFWYTTPTLYYIVRSTDASSNIATSEVGGPYASSCPYIFVWDGEKYVFVTDASSSSTLSIGLDRATWAATPFYKDPNTNNNYPNPEGYAKIQSGNLVARTVGNETFYDIKNTTELNEINYFDSTSLKIIDHDVSVNVFPDYRENGQIHTIAKNAPAPISVVDQDGHDVTSLLSQNDGVYYHSKLNVTPAYIDIKLSNDETTPANLKLLIERGKEGPFSGGSGSDTLQYKNEAGEFVDVPSEYNVFVTQREGAPHPSRLRFNSYGVETKVIDLSGLTIKDNTIRLIMTNTKRMWDIDYLAVDTNPDSAITVTSENPYYADLHFRGISSKVRTNPNDPNMILTEPVYGEVTDAFISNKTTGNATRYGDVTELLQSNDDKFVIMTQGDELAYKYAVPAQASGTERDFIYYTNDYHKAYIYALGDEIGPLPFSAMTQYPYHTDVESYPTDAEHNLYQSTYNTREINFTGLRSDIVPGQLHHSLNTDYIVLAVSEATASTPTPRTSGSIAFGCKDIKATNYQPFGISSPSTCRYAVVANTNTNTNNTLGIKGQCSATQLLTQNLKAGARNGKYNSFAKTIVSEVKILQAHMNRLGFASGKEDGILGPITDGAIKRMQKFLGTKQDGMVGPNTRGLINTSCGEKV